MEFEKAMKSASKMHWKPNDNYLMDNLIHTLQTLIEEMDGATNYEGEKYDAVQHTRKFCTFWEKRGEMFEEGEVMMENEVEADFNYMQNLALEAIEKDAEGWAAMEEEKKQDLRANDMEDSGL